MTVATGVLDRLRRWDIRWDVPLLAIMVLAFALHLPHLGRQPRPRLRLMVIQQESSFWRSQNLRSRS